MLKEQYRYDLSSTEGSSQQYGNCDICGKHASEVFIQSEKRHYKIERDGFYREGWTKNKCNDYFGHKECLESKQR